MKVLIYETIPRNATEKEKEEIFINGIRCIGFECFWNMHSIFADVGQIELFEPSMEYIKRCYRAKIYSSIASEIVSVANKYTRCLMPKLNGMLVRDDIAVAFIEGYVEGIKQYDLRREEFCNECEDNCDM